jgi:ribosomal protein S18 acetylase RimI-like enzyme
VGKYRKQGIAASIVKAILPMFMSENIYRILIRVESENIQALRFWINHGFRVSSGKGGTITALTLDLPYLELELF